MQAECNDLAKEQPNEANSFTYENVIEKLKTVGIEVVEKISRKDRLQLTLKTFEAETNLTEDQLLDLLEKYELESDNGFSLFYFVETEEIEEGKLLADIVMEIDYDAVVSNEKLTLIKNYVESMLKVVPLLIDKNKLPISKKEYKKVTEMNAEEAKDFICNMLKSNRIEVEVLKEVGSLVVKSNKIDITLLSDKALAIVNCMIKEYMETCKKYNASNTEPSLSFFVSYDSAKGKTIQIGITLNQAQSYSKDSLKFSANSFVRTYSTLYRSASKKAKTGSIVEELKERVFKMGVDTDLIDLDGKNYFLKSKPIVFVSEASKNIVNGIIHNLYQNFEKEDRDPSILIETSDSEASIILVVRDRSYSENEVNEMIEKFLLIHSNIVSANKVYDKPISEKKLIESNDVLISAARSLIKDLEVVKDIIDNGLLEDLYKLRDSYKKDSKATDCNQ